MDDFNFEDQFDSFKEKVLDQELIDAFQKLKKYKNEVKLADKTVKELLSLRSKAEGNSVSVLKDDEIIYCVKHALEYLTPVTKSFRATQVRFGKEQIWSKRAIRYHPIKRQVRCVMKKLAVEEFPPLKLIKRHCGLNEEKLLTFTEWRALINHLKKLLSRAQVLESKDLEISRLENLLTKQKEENQSLKFVKKNSLLLPQSESIQVLCKEFPELTIKEISKAKGISRQTIYRYLK